MDKLKIDRSFADKLGEDAEIDGIVTAIVDLARATKMTATADLAKIVGGSAVAQTA